MYILSKYLWLLVIAVIVFDALLLKLTTLKLVRENPELARSYSRFIRAFVTWPNLPWVVMGIGILSGRTPTFWNYFIRIREQPFVLLWWASDFLTLAVITYWVFFRGGAELCVKLSGAGAGAVTVIKVVTPALLVATILVFLFLYSANL